MFGRFFKKKRDYIDLEYRIPIEKQVKYDLDWSYICKDFNPDILGIVVEDIVIKGCELKYARFVIKRDIRLTIIIDKVSHKKGYFYIKKKALKANRVKTHKQGDLKIKVLYRRGDIVDAPDASSAKLQIWGTGSEWTDCCGFDHAQLN